MKSLADEGTSVVTADTYLGKEVAAIPQVGGWIREIVKYRWVVIGIAGLLVIAGCILGKKVESRQTVQEQKRRAKPLWLSPSAARPDQDRKTDKRSRVLLDCSTLRRKPHTKNQFGDQARNVYEEITHQG